MIKITAQLYRWNSTGQRCPKTQSDPTRGMNQTATASSLIWLWDEGLILLRSLWDVEQICQKQAVLRSQADHFWPHKASKKCCCCPVGRCRVEDVKRISWVLWLVLICFCAALRRIRSRRKAFMKDTFWVNVWQITLSSYPPIHPVAGQISHDVTKYPSSK